MKASRYMLNGKRSCLSGFFAVALIICALFAVSRIFLEIYLERLIPIEIIPPVICALAAFLIFPPIIFGGAKLCLVCADGEPPKFSHGFSFFKPRLYLKSVVLFVALFIRFVVNAALFFTVPAAMLWVCYKIAEQSTALWKLLTVLQLASTAALFIFAAVFLLIFSLRDFLCVYLICRNNKLSVRRAVGKSKKLLKGEKVRLFSLLFMQIPIFLLSLLIVPAAFLLPNTGVSMAIFAKYLMEKPDSAAII